eukprot:m.118286 g.118286  ORF g.118286 m.118286 type:complete len:879 (+) comp28650_c0_seq3:163-2799(+)
MSEYPTYRPKRRNAVLLLRSAQATGRTPNFYEVAVGLCTKSVKDASNVVNEVLKALRTSKTPKACLLALHHIRRFLNKEHGHHLKTTNPQSHREQLSPRDTFIACRGITALTDLMVWAHWTHCNPEDGSTTCYQKGNQKSKFNTTTNFQHEWLDVIAKCCRELYDFTGQDLSVAEDLATNVELHTILFNLMRTKHANGALALVEELIACPGCNIDLRNTHLQDLLASLSDTQLIDFCRILSGVTFQCDHVSECINVIDFLKQGKGSNRQSTSSKMASTNQAVLVALPGFIPRLLRLLKVKPTPKLLQQLMKTPELFQMALDAAGVGDDVDDDVEAGDGVGDGVVAAEESPVALPPSPQMSQSPQSIPIPSPIGITTTVTPTTTPRTVTPPSRITSPSPSSSPSPLPSTTSPAAHDEVDEDGVEEQLPSRSHSHELNMLHEVMKIAHTMYMCDVLALLSVLCGGKCKQDVQKLLVMHGASAVLNYRFGSISWGNKCRRSTLHGEECDCDPDTRLKRQFLALTRHYCHTGNEHWKRRTMYSALELSHLRTLAEEYELENCEFEELPLDCQNTLCQGNKGLLSRLAHTYMHEDCNEEDLRLLAKSIEGYLRGAPTVDRLFLIKQGFLKSCVSNLLTEAAAENRQETLQSLLDLLGALVKNSSIALNILDDLLCDTQFEAIMSLVTSNLIGSNVFLRALCLTVHRSNVRQRTSRFAKFLSFHNNKINLVSDLIMSVSIADLSNENICCVTTCLMFFVIARREGNLLALFKGLRCRDGIYPGALVLNSYISLVNFWKRLYQHQGRQSDCQSLEMCSGIGMQEWLQTVEMLLDDDRTNTSLLHWQGVHGQTSQTIKDSTCTPSDSMFISDLRYNPLLVNEGLTQ